MSKIIERWDAKKYGKGSDRGTARISGLDIRKMVDRGADPEDVIDYYDKGWFRKQGYKTGGATKAAVDNLRKQLKSQAQKDSKKKGKKKGKKDGGGNSALEDAKTIAEIEFENQKDLLYTRQDIARDIMALEGHYEREKNELSTYVGLLSNL